jgi:hypothetical protein
MGNADRDKNVILEAAFRGGHSSFPSMIVGLKGMNLFRIGTPRKE